LHAVPDLNTVTTADTFGWPQLTSAVAAQDVALKRAGQAPTSIFTGNYGEAGALDVLGTADHLPPVLSGHNTFWLWGPGGPRTARCSWSTPSAHCNRTFPAAAC
jgi:hypothetical protein